MGDGEDIIIQETKITVLKRLVKSHWLTVAFLLGFITDYLLLNRVDDTLDNIILLLYVLLATVSLIFFYVGVTEKMGERISRKLRHYMPMLMQYSFGGLLSGMLIFYGRSGDLFSSAPFFILIIGVIVINEILKKQSERLVYNLAVYFVGIFSYCVLVTPVFFGKMSDWVFVGSGLIALLIIYLIVQVLRKIIPEFLRLQTRVIIFVIGSLYGLMNLLYFANLIPPIPLSLTELEIYQEVEKTSAGNYRIIKEENVWYEYLPLVPNYFHPITGKGVTCFARVYAPTKLATNIVHRWEYLDTNGKWQEQFKTAYKITGENKLGYRGYTTITNIRDGKWRCIVENQRGQVLGKKTFVIDTAKPPTDLVTVVE